MLLNQIFETTLVEGLTRTGRNDTAVIGWGRGMGHQGHMYLASSIITHANESKADPYFVVSRTVGKDDPLTPSEKLSIYKRVFAEHKQIFQSTSDAAPNLNSILSKLQEHGYKKVVVVLGEDQVKAFQYLKNYNGKPTKAGNVLYAFESIDVISRQQTNDPSNILAGPRAKDMRAVLLDPSKLDEDKFAVWRDAMSSKLNDSEVHMIMTLAEHRLKNKSINTVQDITNNIKQGVAEATGDEKFDKLMRQMTGKITPDDADKMFPTQEFEPYNLDPSRMPNEEKYKAKLFPLAYQYWTDGDNADELRALGWEPEYGDDYVMVVLYGIGHDGHIQYDKYDFDAEGNDEEDELGEDAADNGPYEYVVHYNDPKTRISGTRTVKTAQPAPKSDSPAAGKFFGKWTGSYTAHEKRSDIANRAHHIVSQGEKKTESTNDVEENFADGKNPGRKGLAKRSGVDTKSSVGNLRKTAKNSSGEKQRMAHWLANMKAGRSKNESNVVPVGENIELQMSALIKLLESKK